MDVYVLTVKTIEPAPGILGGVKEPVSQNLGAFDSLEQCYNFAERIIDKEVVLASYKEWKDLIEVEDELNESCNGCSSEIFYGTSYIDYTFDGKEIYTRYYLIIQKFELNNDLL